VRRPHVFLDDRRDVAGMEGMEVEGGLNRDVVRVFHLQPFSPSAFSVQHFWYSAVTVVERPPRGVKSPTTVMRRGAHTPTKSSRIWFVTAS